MKWEVEFHEDFDPEFDALPEEVARVEIDPEVVAARARQREHEQQPAHTSSGVFVLRVSA